MKKQIGAVIAGSILLIGGFLWYVMGEEPDISKTVKDQIPDMTMSYTGNVLKEERDGKLIWEVTAEKIDVDANSKMAKMQNMKAKFYRDNGIVTELVAQEAEYNQKTNLITMSGAIEATESDGSLLKADEAQYDGQKRQLMCDGNVEVIKSGYHITGEHLTADDESGKVRVEGNAKAIRTGA